MLRSVFPSVCLAVRSLISITTRPDVGRFSSGSCDDRALCYKRGVIHETGSTKRIVLSSKRAEPRSFVLFKRRLLRQRAVKSGLHGVPIKAPPADREMPVAILCRSPWVEVKISRRAIVWKHLVGCTSHELRAK